MAKQGAPHETMVEAFAKRLQQLYPDPPTRYSLGRKVTPPGLKPDVYVEHPDGRKWAFEMVHGNRSPEHMLDNHARYAEAGISDHWILWEILSPAPPNKRTPEQGVITGLVAGKATYRLTRPQKAILDMQGGSTRYLYAFTTNPFGVPRADLFSPFIRMVTTGLDVFTFDEPDNQGLYQAILDFVPLMSLEFAPDGTLLTEAESLTEKELQTLLAAIGLDFGSEIIPMEALQRIEQVLLGKDAQNALRSELTASFLKSASSEERQELAAFFSIGGSVNTPRFETILSGLTMEQILNDPAKLEIVASEMERLRQYGEEQPGLPQILRRYHLEMARRSDLPFVASLMRWMSESEAFRNARREQ